MNVLEVNIFYKIVFIFTDFIKISRDFLLETYLGILD